MHNLSRGENGDYIARTGADIMSTIAEAIALSAEENDKVITFEFNYVTVSVRSDSNPGLIHRDWSRSLNGYIGKSVGPNPNPVLTDEEKESDALIEEKNERRRQKGHAKYEAKAKAKQEAVKAKLINAPGIELADEAGWQKFKEVNGDNDVVVTYAERWARLMQLEMSNGKNLEDVVDATHQEADLGDITGPMYGSAVSILSQCWKHGEQLRRWHNL